MNSANLEAIFVVAGHGGEEKKGVVDNGCSGNDTTERKEVVEIAKELIVFLKEQQALNHVAIFDIGVNEGVTLTDKIKQVNAICKPKNWDYRNSILISVHANCGGGEGVEGWYYGNDPQSMELSRSLASAMGKETGLKFRGIKSEYWNRHKQLGIVHQTLPLATLLECGFIDNIRDVRVLKDPIADDGFAIGIAKGLMAYLGGEYKTPPQQVNTGFSDVPADAWYRVFVEKVAKEGIMTGYADNTFKPADNVSRAELAKVACLLLEKMENLKLLLNTKL